MDTLDNETMEQIKNIVNDAKNNNTPLQKAKRTKKVKEVNITPDIPPEVGPTIHKEEEPLKKPKLTRSKSIKTNINIVEQLPTPEPEPEREPEPEPEPILEPVLEPVKKKRVQSEKQKAAFLLLQEKRREQVEKLKLQKKIEASKVLLENDIPLKVKKPKSTKINFDEDGTEDEEDTPEEDPEPKPKRASKVQVVKQWGTSTRNKKSIKPPQNVNESHEYATPAFF